MSNPNKIDQLGKSDGFEDILGTPPSWPVRWGSSLVFFIFLLFMFLGWLIKYPDIISSRIVLTTMSPPARLFSKVNGRIMKKWVIDNQSVNQGDKLILLENTSDFEDIAYVDSFLDSTRTSFLSLNPSLDFEIVESLNLGEFQPEYLNFIRSYKDLKLFKEQERDKKQIASIFEQLGHYKSLKLHLIKKLTLFKEELVLAESEHKRNVKLYESNVIAQKDFEISQQVLLSKKQMKEEIEASIIQTSLKISELNNLSGEVGMGKSEKEQKLTVELADNYKRLLESIKQWKQKFLMTAPISGRITFFSKYWSENQFVTTGDEVLTVVPNDSSKLIGKVITPLNNSGKIKIGQKVNIMLDNYPFEEFGLIEGMVKGISLVPKDNLYSIEVELVSPNLTTTYGKVLPFKQEMQGSAEIITEDLRLISRVFYNLRKRIFQRNSSNKTL